MSVTLIVIIITCAVSLIAFSKRELMQKLQFNPYSVLKNKEHYRFFTHALLHGDWGHLFVNMYVLYNFGELLEILFDRVTGHGWLFFLIVYVGGVLFACLPSLKRHKDNPSYSAVGASGAISAILFSFIIFMPTAPLNVMFIPIDIPAVVIGLLYLAYEVYQDKRGRDNVAHDAHYMGAIFGIVITLIIEPSLAMRFVNQIKVFFG